MYAENQAIQKKRDNVQNAALEWIIRNLRALQNSIVNINSHMASIQPPSVHEITVTFTFASDINKDEAARFGFVTNTADSGTRYVCSGQWTPAYKKMTLLDTAEYLGIGTEVQPYAAAYATVDGLSSLTEPFQTPAIDNRILMITLAVETDYLIERFDTPTVYYDEKLIFAETGIKQHKFLGDRNTLLYIDMETNLILYAKNYATLIASEKIGGKPVFDKNAVLTITYAKYNYLK